jgi:hypothetical protein
MLAAAHDQRWIGLASLGYVVNVGESFQDTLSTGKAAIGRVKD